jgi:photosystem II stability/assembly factor-like uncharacterized protein
MPRIPSIRAAVVSAAGALSLIAVSFLLGGDDSRPPREAGKTPNEWFLRQRAWPHPDINQTARLEAWERAAELRSAEQRSGPAWDPVGPRNIGGRVADVACHPTDSNIVYVGGAEGGILKTTNGGTTWTPTFDDESSLSVGSVAIDPNDPETIWVGTGEPNGGGGSVTYGGTGVFRSTNGGATWTNMGLPDSRYIGRVVVDPSNSDRVFVAVLGAMWSTNPERGVYRTTNGGSSWEQVHAINDSTGAVDLVVHPTDSNLVYAAMWERTRAPDNLNYGGDGSGIWRSTNGGDAWSELTNGLPGGASVGRIGISIAASSPNTLYAIYADASPGSFAGVFKTTDGGDSWAQTNDGNMGGVYATYGWWFGNIRVDPTNPNRVFVLGYDFFRTTNGGGSWHGASGSMHVDHHGQAFAPNGTIYEGNDGGMYRSTNGGTAWTKLGDLPLTQFYTVEVDHQFPDRRYGGTQDNGTNRTLTGGDNDWHNILGGDGFYCQVDPTNNAYVYAEWQYGNLNRSTNGGSSFMGATSGLSGRRNWSMPVMMDPSNPSTLYTGTQWVYRSTNRAAFWSAISPDLTDGPSGGNNTYATITTIAVAATDPDVIWAGTDDSNVWVTTNGGTNWTKVDAALPERWVTRVAVDPSDATISYVTISGFRWDDPLPHVFRSTNFGASWTDISSNLPEVPVNDIVLDPQSPQRLYVATDFGVFTSPGVGGPWSALGTGLPNVVVTDLELHDPTRSLVAGTYGRSMWTLELDQPTGVEDVVAAVSAVRLRPVAPNPAPGGRAAIRFSLPRAAEASVRIYDVTGRLVRRLVDEPLAAGERTLQWDGRDDSGRLVADGVYLVRLVADGVSRTRKVTVLR